ncbi:ABC transporter permease [Patescibacteria group bacterium]|nr:MAG: ABC transporter permease [Patescibacteria group bacterium]
MFISFFRVIKASLQDFVRNFWLSVVTTSILALALISVNILLVLNILAGVALDAVSQRISVSVYLKPTAGEEVVAAMKSSLLAQPSVMEVTVTSADEALRKLQERHPDNEAIQNAVSELGKNPLGPSLAVKARSTNDYPAILASLEHPSYAPYIQEKNFDDHRDLIARIRRISEKVERTAISVSALFAIISLLIVWNSIRITIYTHREEIGIMRLVGASAWFIRMPYIIEALLYSLLGTLIAAAVIFPLSGAVGPSIRNFFDGTQFDLLGFFEREGWRIFGIEFLVAAALTTITSGIAVGRYLKR